MIVKPTHCDEKSYDRLDLIGWAAECGLRPGTPGKDVARSSRAAAISGRQVASSAAATGNRAAEVNTTRSPSARPGRAGKADMTNSFGQKAPVLGGLDASVGPPTVGARRTAGAGALAGSDAWNAVEWTA